MISPTKADDGGMSHVTYILHFAFSLGLVAGCDEVASESSQSNRTAGHEASPVAEESVAQIVVGRPTRVELGNTSVDIPADGIDAPNAHIRLRRSESPEIDAANAAVLVAAGDSVRVEIIDGETGELLPISALRANLTFSQKVRASALDRELVGWVQTSEGNSVVRQSAMTVLDGSALRLTGEVTLRVTFELAVTDAIVAIFELQGALTGISEGSQIVIRGGSSSTTTASSGEDSSGSTGGETSSTTGGETSGTSGGTTGSGSGSHRIFLTSGYFHGDLPNSVRNTVPTQESFSGSGLEAADLICAYHAAMSQDQSVASSNGPGKWKAIISTSNVNAKDRIQINGPVHLVSRPQDVVAANTAEFWSGGALGVAIDRDQDSNVVNATSFWSGTNSDGVRFNTDEGSNASYCGDWTSTGSTSTLLSFVGVGTGTGNAPQWRTDITAHPCFNTKKLLCIEQ
jgi:hypothetical protein